MLWHSRFQSQYDKPGCECSKILCLVKNVLGPVYVDQIHEFWPIDDHKCIVSDVCNNSRFSYINSVFGISLKNGNVMAPFIVLMWPGSRTWRVWTSCSETCISTWCKCCCCGYEIWHCPNNGLHITLEFYVSLQASIFQLSNFFWEMIAKLTYHFTSLFGIGIEQHTCTEKWLGFQIFIIWDS